MRDNKEAYISMKYDNLLRFIGLKTGADAPDVWAALRPWLYDALTTTTSPDEEEHLALILVWEEEEAKNGRVRDFVVGSLAMQLQKWRKDLDVVSSSENTRGGEKILKVYGSTRKSTRRDPFPFGVQPFLVAFSRVTLCLSVCQCKH